MSNLSWEEAIGICAYTNLDKRPDRDKFMRDQLEREGIVAHRVTGIDSRIGIPGEMPFKAMKSKPVAWHQVPDNIGFLGAMYAFGMTISMAKICGAKNILFLEDDAVLPLGTKDIILRELESAPEHWDVLNFGSIAGQPKRVKPYNERWAWCDSQIMTHCILVNQSAYNMILEICSMQPARGTVDSLINLLPGLRYYMTSQAYFPQLSDVSDTTYTRIEGLHRSSDGLTDGIRPNKDDPIWSTGQTGN